MSRDPVVVARARGDTEITGVSPTTEVKIPWLNYLKFGQVLMFLDLIAWVTGWLIWARRRAPDVGYWQWFAREWLPWFALDWPWVTITLLLCWIGPSFAYSAYLLVEILAKRTPAYTPWNSEWGIWRPQIFRRFNPPDELDDEEMESRPETVDVRLWDIVRGKKHTKRRMQMREIPGFPATKRARSFYHAVASGAKPFSERGAKGCLSRRQFRELRDLLEKRGLGHWRNQKHKEQGFVLSDRALRSFEVLGKRQ